jgi:Uncharacterized conserved protein
MKAPTFFLEGIMHERDETSNFEGPLNVILMLLSKNKIEIRDIQISLILEQYLEFISKMEETDLEIASEFAQMASHLLYLKTATLLKSDEEVSELELLMESLEQIKNKGDYSRVKIIAPELGKIAERGLMMYVRGPEPQKNVPPYAYSHEGVELLKALRAVFFRGAAYIEADEPQGIIPARIVYNVREKSREIISIMRGGENISLKKLFSGSKSRSEFVATFISVLELCASGYLMFSESEEGVMASFTGDADMDEILEALSEGQSSEEG